MLPSFPPKQETAVKEELTTISEGWPTVIPVKKVQPFPSVTVTV